MTDRFRLWRRTRVREIVCRWRYGYGWIVLWTSHLGAPLVHLQTSQYYLDGRCSSSTQDHAYSISTPFFFFLKRQFPNKWQTVKHGQPLQKLHATASRQLVSSVNSSTSLGVCYLRLQYTRSSDDEHTMIG
jgi:hypothetical protein